MTALTLSNDSIIIDDQLRNEAMEFVETAQADRLDPLKVVRNGVHHTVPPALSRLLVDVIESVARVVGTHHRVLAQDVVALREQGARARVGALQALCDALPG